MTNLLNLAVYIRIRVGIFPVDEIDGVVCFMAVLKKVYSQ